MLYIGGILRIDLTLTDLTIIKQLMEASTIQGKDAVLIAKTIVKINKAIEKCPEPVNK